MTAIHGPTDRSVGKMGELWLSRFSPRPSAPLRLFCFPHAGGAPAVFRPWAEALHDVDLQVVQLPGRATRHRETPIASVSGIVDGLLPVLLAQLDRPYALFGHSMGSLIAYEVARAIAARGVTPPVHVFVSGRRAPHLRRDEPDIHRLPDATFVDEINRRYGGIPAELLNHPDVMALLLPTLRADMTAIETYALQPGAPLECAISAFGGLDDRHTTMTELMGWQVHTRLPVVVRQFTGDHFYFSRRDVLDLLLAEVRTTLHASMADRAGANRDLRDAHLVEDGGAEVVPSRLELA